MSKPLPAFLAALILIFAAATAQAQQIDPTNKGDMTFTRLDVSSICPDCSVVQAKGEFTKKTMDEYRNFVWKERFKKNIYFVFDSNGGTIKSAIELGLVMRTLKVNTIVGRASIRNGEIEIDPANCASACVLAYAGGVTRSMPQGSKLGIHRWAPLDSESGDGKKKNSKPQLMDEEGVAIVQKQVALHLKYFQMMGIDLRIAIPLLETPYSSITWITPKDRSLWNLVTIDSKLSTPADRRRPILFLPVTQPIPGKPTPGQDKLPSNANTAHRLATEALPSAL
ncbi:hypothetical protein [Microvirga solisilvae]|uniref:COG3904 family protein n=1 Tax=Microvirga solisilvae TaxID=2919498 RepID=UPI001FAF29B7|nr:hypothetical protein [Microvirga solisilvae]